MFAALQKFSTPLLLRSNYYLCGDVSKLNYSKKLSQREIKAVYKSLCLMNDNIECYASSFFKDLFKKYPDYAKFFKKYGCNADEILKNKKFVEKHATGNVMSAISEFIKKLDDVCEAESYMKKIGKKHQKYCMKPEHFKNTRKVLLRSLEFNLGDKWDAEVEEGWTKATKIMVRALNKGLKAE